VKNTVWKSVTEAARENEIRKSDPGDIFNNQDYRKINTKKMQNCILNNRSLSNMHTFNSIYGERLHSYNRQFRLPEKQSIDLSLICFVIFERVNVYRKKI